ncbi:expressed unknown protein [Seminavis robusta]|uniref:Uncharacterized protein n=1 Tax=Seminavis robusta TaxID=568900 RepID=A0A9N8HDY2_9STRA|nr:expressed unknown protein [Seminavis robusta]|eukprot:Sro381_g130870.1 n/a (256) ;mRNA; r:50764-51531
MLSFVKDTVDYKSDNGEFNTTCHPFYFGPAFTDMHLRWDDSSYRCNTILVTRVLGRGLTVFVPVYEKALENRRYARLLQQHGEVSPDILEQDLGLPVQHEYLLAWTVEAWKPGGALRVMHAEGGEIWKRYQKGGDLYEQTQQRHQEGGDLYERYHAGGDLYERYQKGGDLYERYHEGGDRYEQIQQMMTEAWNPGGHFREMYSEGGTHSKGRRKGSDSASELVQEYAKHQWIKREAPNGVCLKDNQLWCHCCVWH